MRLLVLSLLCATSLQAQRPPAPAIAVTGVTVVDVATGALVRNQTVIVTGERITTVGPAGTTRAPAGARTLNGTGNYLIPGLWDMHVHLSYSTASALPVLLANGVTTVRDLGSDLSDIDTWR